MATALNVKHLQQVSDNPDPVLYDLKGDLAALAPQMRTAKITTKARVGMFLANVGPETDRLKTLEEYGDEAYFRSFLGTEWMYHGRGYLMNTWRAAYAQLAEVLNAPLLKNPDLLAENKTLAAKAAVWFWTKHALNVQADKGNFLGVCSTINRGELVPRGAINGWSERQKAWNRAKAMLPGDLYVPEGGTIIAPPKTPIERAIEYLLKLVDPNTPYGFWDGKFPFTPGPAMWANVKVGQLPKPKTQVPNASCTGIMNLAAAAGGSTYRGGTLAYAKDIKNKRPYKPGMRVRRGEVLLDRYMETSKVDEGHIVMILGTGENPKVISSDHRFGGDQPGVNIHPLDVSYKHFDYDWIGEIPGLDVA